MGSRGRLRFCRFWVLTCFNLSFIPRQIFLAQTCLLVSDVVVRQICTCNGVTRYHSKRNHVIFCDARWDMRKQLCKTTQNWRRLSNFNCYSIVKVLQTKLVSHWADGIPQRRLVVPTSPINKQKKQAWKRKMPCSTGNQSSNPRCDHVAVAC